MELDDTLVKAELDDIMARIDGIMRKVEKFEGNSKEKPPEPNEESAFPFGAAYSGGS
jgi:hypothetical protein